MKQRSYILLLFSILLSANGYAQKGIMRLSQQTLMHEVRETPSPLDGQHIAVNPPRFMWPDKYPHLGAVLDGVEEEDFKPEELIVSASHVIRSLSRKLSPLKGNGHSSILSNCSGKENGIGSTHTLTKTVRRNGRLFTISM